MDSWIDVVLEETTQWCATVESATVKQRGHMPQTPSIESRDFFVFKIKGTDFISETTVSDGFKVPGYWSWLSNRIHTVF